MYGNIHSICSMSTKDGPGIRTVVFMQGCPLRCIYCHNPDTRQPKGAEIVTPSELIDRIARFSSYFGRDGGITFSGGEPLMQPDFLHEAIILAKERGIHTAIDTAGARPVGAVWRAANAADLIILDIKMPDAERYKQHTDGDLDVALDFLSALDKAKKPVWIRQVIVPKINDQPQDVLALSALISPYSCIRRIELLPFRTLCRDKYSGIGIDFPLEGTPDMGADALEQLIVLLPEKYRHYDSTL